MFIAIVPRATCVPFILVLLTRSPGHQGRSARLARVRPDGLREQGPGRQAQEVQDRDEAQRQRNQPQVPARREAGRSEEHTSELPSLMRISYAVFCLKKKT